MVGVSRRALLTAGTAAGAAGISGLATAGTAQASSARSLVLSGTNMQILGERRRKAVGDTLTVRGLLHEGPGAPAAGEVLITGSVVAGASDDPTDATSFEHHLFRLGKDTITGSGVVGHDGSGSFTVTGGSGRFAGARGTYTSRQSADHSGDGVAEFTFLLHR
jgi:hypothetical protein